MKHLSGIGNEDHAQEIPKGYHKMPDGTVMKDSEHKIKEAEYADPSKEHYKKALAAGFKGSYEDYVKEYGSFPEEFPKNEASKPDFLDLDKDGNKTEPMKKAVADKELSEILNLAGV